MTKTQLKNKCSKDYQRIHWDFRAVDNFTTYEYEEKIPLLERMKKAGFSEAEFAKLTEAKANSDGLVDIETKAMNMVKGLYQDVNGEYTLRKAPDLDQARALMHDENYHRYKANIMKPVDGFFELLDERTQAQLITKENRHSQWLIITFFSAATLVSITLITWPRSWSMLLPYLNLTRSILPSFQPQRTQKIIYQSAPGILCPKPIYRTEFSRLL